MQLNCKNECVTNANVLHFVRQPGTRTIKMDGKSDPVRLTSCSRAFCYLVWLGSTFGVAIGCGGEDPTMEADPNAEIPDATPDCALPMAGAGGCDATNDASGGAHGDGGGGGNGAGGAGGAGAGSAALWSGGHGDLTFSFQPPRGDPADDGEALHAFFRFENATLDGAPGVDGDFATDEILIRSSARFTRPDADNDFFAPLCIESGETAFWIPQRNADAASFGVPFVGMLVDFDSAVLLDDEVTLELIGVSSPSGSGSYSLWRDGFPPAFFFSSCRGIDSEDRLTLPLGHDHFNMGFTEPGRWEVVYRASAHLVADGSTKATDVTVHYLLE